MFLWHVFSTNPLVGIALSICLATIFWCIAILHKRQKGPDRFLATLIGIISVWQGLQLLRQAGLIAVPHSNQLPGFAEFTVTALCLVSVLILRISMVERKTTQVRLRLVESNGPAKIDRSLTHEERIAKVSELILDANPLATVALDKSGVVTYWNAAAERLLGWSAAEMLGKSGSMLLNSPVRNKAGKSLDVESWVSTMHDPVGRACGTVLMMASQPQTQTEKAAMDARFSVNMLAPAAGR